MGRKKKTLPKRENGASAQGAGPHHQHGDAPGNNAPGKNVVQRALLLQSWFEKNQRWFPWRHSRDPYRTWLAEVMSQQTVMTALIPYFQRFLAAFPDLESLARASEEQVLAQWAGLGYYSRARWLHRAAKILHQTAEEKGSIPQDLSFWRSLPGVGPYTAAAVVSQCFEIPAPLWDGNVLRWMSRYKGEEYPYTKSFQEGSVSELSHWLVVKGVKPSLLNQAFMELGATVCVPRSPRCGICPVSESCVAFLTNRTGQLPPPKPRPSTIDIQACAYLVLRREGNGHQVLLRLREKPLWYAGLWDFPTTLGSAKQPVLSGVEAVVPHKNYRASLKGGERGEVRHAITRHRISLLWEVLEIEASPVMALQRSEQWVPLDVLLQTEAVREALPLASTAKKVLKSWRESLRRSS